LKWRFAVYAALVGWFGSKATRSRKLLIVAAAPSSPFMLMLHSPSLLHLCLPSPSVDVTVMVWEGRMDKLGASNRYSDGLQIYKGYSRIANSGRCLGKV
jgi:hypothetical protein